MKLLLDTHVLIWITENSRRVSRKAAEAARSRENSVFVSAVSAWEIANKVWRGKLTFDLPFLDDFDANLRALAFEPLRITAKQAVAGAQLPGDHKDPFDRILAGQALTEGLTLVSADPAFKTFGIDTLW